VVEGEKERKGENVGYRRLSIPEGRTSRAKKKRSAQERRKKLSKLVPAIVPSTKGRVFLRAGERRGKASWSGSLRSMGSPAGGFLALEKNDICKTHRERKKGRV